MKRSRKVALMLMVPTTTMMLASCGEDRTEAMVFSSPEECASLMTNTLAEQCYADFKAAQALHPHVAPKYTNKSECENDFGAGQCEPAPQQHASGSFFMPLMMGYMAGQMFNRQGAAMPNQQQQDRPAGASGAAANTRSNVRTQPLYKSRDDRGTFRTASNTPVARQTGPVMVRPSQVQPRAAQLAQRGGFGAQAAARNSYGG